ncbi:MAG TPA: hypothetical protein VHW09_24915 [Bryobacteraceae bacterium]|jgi:hypothetical protein|nr:hypothetical protein [Bryobacteraceae bacterium]
MKNMITIFAAAIALCGMASAQQATSVDQVKVHFDTPVLAGGSVVAAGDCKIQVLRGATDNLILAMHPQTGGTVFVIATRASNGTTSADQSKSAKVVLSKRGDTYRFDRIVMPDQSGFEITGAE